MKFRALFIFLFCYVKVNFAQLYQPFPTDSAVWRQQNASWDGDVWDQDDYNYFFRGDTIISGNTYHKIYHTGSHTEYVTALYPPWTIVYGPLSVDSNKYVGGIREDGLKHVFFFPDTATVTSEQLLYDFNLSLGDTLPVTYCNTNSYGGIKYVSSIDSVLVGAVYHKCYHISAGPGYMNLGSIIEGVGNSSGLLEKILPVFEYEDLLICYSHNGAFEYIPTLSTPSPTATCELPLLAGINEYKNEKSITIFPNPSSGNLTIRSNLTGDINVEINNLLGEKIVQLILNSSQTSIDLSTFPKGLYFLKAKSGNITESIQKIVLQ
ncbi:MAG: T9SS type A sorting domain-containing protein [Bacteroidia bacterium]